MQNLIFCMERGQPARIFQALAGETPALHGVLQLPLTTIRSFTALSGLDGAMPDTALDRKLREMVVVLEDYHLLVLDRVLWHFFAKESG